MEPEEGRSPVQYGRAERPEYRSHEEVSWGGARHMCEDGKRNATTKPASVFASSSAAAHLPIVFRGSMDGI